MGFRQHTAEPGVGGQGQGRISLCVEQGLDDRAIAMMKPFIVGDLVCKGAPEDTKLYFRCVDRGHFLFENFHEGQSGGYVSYAMRGFYN